MGEESQFEAYESPGAVARWKVLLALSSLSLAVGVMLVASVVVTALSSPAAPTFTPAPSPTLANLPELFALPAAGGPGTTVAVSGANWSPSDTVYIYLVDPTGVQPEYPVASSIVEADGRFTASFVFPYASPWATMPSVLLTAVSTTTGQRVETTFAVLQPTLSPPSPPASVTPLVTVPPIVIPTFTPLPVSTPSPTGWRGEYFNNRVLMGAPVLVHDDATLDFNWGQASPAVSLSADDFSARWTRTMLFEEGLYRFHALVDDGVRLYVDGALVIDAWSDGSRREVTGDVRLTPGNHSLRVEYYEHVGEASLRVWWEKVATYPDWRGEYWPNRNLEGASTLVRNDVVLDFDWGLNAPAPGLPADDFSVRWTRLADFEMGTYRFHLLVDDGARLWVDGQPVLDSWQDGSVRELTADLALTQGLHSLRVEYYEHAVQARLSLWWERLVSPAYPDWRGEYWSNRELRGNPALVRNDRQIDFRWETGSPATGLPVDDFSVRWSREADFSAGQYRLFARADDGVRVYVDETLVLDEWHDSDGSRTYMVNLLLRDRHRVTAEYYERTGKASVQVWWERVGDWPTPTPSATPPATQAPTATSTPTAMPTSTPTPTSAATPTSTPTPTPSVVASATATPAGTVPPTATPVVVPTATVTPAATIGVTVTATVTPTVAPTATFTPTATPVEPAGVWISEILPFPSAVDWDGDGAVDAQDEWIELHNTTALTISLEGWFLGSVEGGGMLHRFPAGTQIGPQGYLLRFRRQTGVILADGGDRVVLLGPTAALVDVVTFAALPADASVSRDDSGGWHTDWPPSPGGPNAAAVEGLQAAPPTPTPTPTPTRVPRRWPWPRRFGH